MRKAEALFKSNKIKLLEKLNADIETRSLAADILIQKLFSLAKFVETTPDILEKARNRFDSGKPPGKSNSYGDAINWESILKGVQEAVFKETYIIAEDGDYRSMVDETKLKSFLSDEWIETIGEEVHYYRNLTLFFKDKYPRIKLGSEISKAIYIKRLVGSKNYKETKWAIADLNEIVEFSSDQIKEIFQASVSNNQIYWIRDDKPIQDFFWGLFSKYHSSIPQALSDTFRECYTLEAED